MTEPANRSLSQGLATRATLCLVTTMAFIGAHELVHIAAGQALGIGGHFTSLTSADADPGRVLKATPAARAWMTGSAPMFTMLAGLCALATAPVARARSHKTLAAVLGWMAIFGISYVGVQLMTLAGPAGQTGTGVDTAEVLVGYFGIGHVARAALGLGGLGLLLGAGFLLGRALGDRRRLPAGDFARLARAPGFRRGIGVALVVLSACGVGLGAALLFWGRGNPMGPLLLADVLWGLGLMLMTPFQRSGPRFVRDAWFVPAAVAMAVLTAIGVLLPSDYQAAGLFFLPQLATATFAVRNDAFSGELDITT